MKTEHIPLDRCYFVSHSTAWRKGKKLNQIPNSFQLPTDLPPKTHTHTHTHTHTTTEPQMRERPTLLKTFLLKPSLTVLVQMTPPPPPDQTQPLFFCWMFPMELTEGFHCTKQKAQSQKSVVTVTVPFTLQSQNKTHQVWTGPCTHNAATCV